MTGTRPLRSARESATRRSFSPRVAKGPDGNRSGERWEGVESGVLVSLSSRSLHLPTTLPSFHSGPEGLREEEEWRE